MLLLTFNLIHFRSEVQSNTLAFQHRVRFTEEETKRCFFRFGFFVAKFTCADVVVYQPNRMFSLVFRLVLFFYFVFRTMTRFVHQSTDHLDAQSLTRPRTGGDRTMISELANIKEHNNKNRKKKFKNEDNYAQSTVK